MELTMTNNFGFCELNEDEMALVDGGAITTNFCSFVVSSVVGMAATPIIAKGAVSLGKHIGIIAGSSLGPGGALVCSLIGAGIGLVVANILIN